MRIFGAVSRSAEGERDETWASGAREVLKQLHALLAALTVAEAELSRELSEVASEARAGAINLVHYVAFRRFDVRPLQERLSALGLSSLGRSEARIRDAIVDVVRLLERLLGESPSALPGSVAEAASERLGAHTARLLGASETCRIMVTLPGEAAEDPAITRDLLAAGMDVARINCAHDDERAWCAMVDHLTQAKAQLGRACRVLFDLPGPKLRTLDVAPGPRVVHLAPERDAWGRPLRPARLFLRAVEPERAEQGAEPPPGEIWLAAAWLARLREGSVVSLRDTRGKRRRLRVTVRTPEGAWVETRQSTYVCERTKLRCGPKRPRHGARAARPLRVPARPQALELSVGDTLILSGDGLPGLPARRDETGRVCEPARIACALPEIVKVLEVGAPVLFDDGKIAGVVSEVRENEAVIRIREAGAGCAKLRGERGINLPALSLELPALGEDDRRALAVATRHADLVGLSFARDRRDVQSLHRELSAQGAAHLGVVLKIETRRGFEQLPEMLLEALKRPPVGVMIARGDLAVECGFERLAELQEEILWLCEAAHVPAIWATQVLERLAKKGQATRAEITDAAMAERAECVMLNKGPHIVRTVRTLRDIIGRMRGHQLKKRALLRPLRSPRLARGEPQQEPEPAPVE